MNITSLFKRRPETVTACMARHDGGYRVHHYPLILLYNSANFCRYPSYHPSIGEPGLSALGTTLS